MLLQALSFSCRPGLRRKGSGPALASLAGAESIDRALARQAISIEAYFDSHLPAPGLLIGLDMGLPGRFRKVSNNKDLLRLEALLTQRTFASGQKKPGGFCRGSHPVYGSSGGRIFPTGHPLD